MNNENHTLVTSTNQFYSDEYSWYVVTLQTRVIDYH